MCLAFVLDRLRFLKIPRSIRISTTIRFSLASCSNAPANDKIQYARLVVREGVLEYIFPQIVTAEWTASIESLASIRSFKQFRLVATRFSELQNPPLNFIHFIQAFYIHRVTSLHIEIR